MTLNDIKQNIAESNNKDWSLNYEIHLNYSHIDYKISLKGIPSIYEFVVNQIEGYEKFPELPEEFIRIKQRFESVKNNIILLITNKDFNQNKWENCLYRITNNNPQIFISNTPEMEFFINVYNDKPLYFKGVYEYYTGQFQNINNKDSFIGYLLAYEFDSKSFSSMATRKDLEIKSMKETRIDFQHTLEEANSQMIEYLSNAKKGVIDNAKFIDSLKEEKDSLFNNWFTTTTNNFLSFHNDSIQKITDFEVLYKEKLKLEAPAQYWSDRAKKLRSEGNNWLKGMIAAIFLGVVLLIWCLSEISAGTLDNIFQNNGTAIKWSVVFITLISFIAFAVKIFSKLTFRSFHLVRDAEEREQLTYVYLALKKEKSIDDTERHLIMQSLFSRADSGLLKDDAGPTMPGNIAEKIINR